jgi:DNA polymerase-3 subunit delta
MTKYLIYGDDELGKEEFGEKIKKKFSKNYSSVNIETHNFNKKDSNLNLQELRTKLYSIPFLSEKKLLILKNLLASSSKEQVKQEKSLLKDLPTTTILVLLEDEINSSLKKALAEADFKMKEFKSSHGYHLEKWVKDRAKKIGLNFGGGVVKRFVDLLGSDNNRILRELEKIKNYLAYDGRRNVEMNDLEAIVSPSYDLVIFDLMDKVANKDKKAAASYLEQMISQGVSESYIIAMLESTISNLIAARDLIDENNKINANMLAKEFGWHPFVAKKVYSQVRNFNKKDLVNLYQHLFSVEYNIKSGKSNGRMELTLFLSQI